MKTYRIVNRGDGSKIEGTRITLYQIHEYAEKGYSREQIAALLDLSSLQVHKEEVSGKYDAIMARIRQGNPPQVKEQLARNRAKLQARMAELAQQTGGAEPNARSHIGQ